MHCKRLDNIYCVAFPEGIPLEVLSGKIIHNKIIPGQEGNYIFEQN
jgi:hypothetical protein